jgi:NADH:ubiquinone oxidoreductase subunit 6 (subunit J)
MFGIILYTVAAIVLYLFSDWVLNQIEIKRGTRLEHRSLIFFVIIMVLALSTFSLIERMVGTPGESAKSQNNTLVPKQN